MKFFYSTKTDILGISFQPAGKTGKQKRREVMPGIFMGFDARGKLSLIEIMQASQHQPDLKHFIQDLVKEILSNASQIPQDVLLAIEKTVKLSDDDPEESIDYSPRLSFDSVANVVVTEFRDLKPGEILLPKQEVIPNVLASFDEEGQLITLEMLQALQHIPSLRQFIDQGNELLAVQQFFK